MPVQKAENTAESKNLELTNNKQTINPQGAAALRSYVLGGLNSPSFTGFPCSTGEFNRHMMSVTCACCGKKMINGTENALKMADTLRDATGDDRLKFIDDNMDIFRPVEKVIIKGLRKHAEQRPNKSTYDLVNIVAQDSREILKQGQLDVLNAVDEEAKKLYGEGNEISKYVNSQKKFVTGLSGNQQFTREKFVKKIDELTSNEQDFDAKGKVLNKAIDMPFESDYFKKMNRDYTDPKKFIRGLFTNAVKTAEHIHPKSKGGPNDTENYMSECNECNENRQNYDLNGYWTVRYPSMPYNVQQYVDIVTDNLINDKLSSRFLDYPLDLKRAVEAETGGAITVDVMSPDEINDVREEKGLPELTLNPQNKPNKKEENAENEGENKKQAKKAA